VVAAGSGISFSTADSAVRGAGLTGVPVAFAQMLASAGRTCSTVRASLLAAQIEAESGWNPRAVSPAGAQGLTQFMPAAWATWGRDANSNGVSSPLDPADAIDAQGRYMCFLATSMAAAVHAGRARGQVVPLALAAYNAGPSAVLRYRGVPPYAETTAYVAHILRLVDRYSADPAGARGGGPVPSGFDRQGNPRTVEQAIAWMQRVMPRGAPGEPVAGACERYMNLSYGLGGGYPRAIDHWNAAGPRTAGYAAPPRGALVFWRTGNPAGHVALSLGDGVVVSTDYDSRTHRYRVGRLSAGPIGDIDRWGPRLGWRAPNFRAGSEA
jgi:hypothetical protein